MTIDEALKQIKGSSYCWIMWNTSTGEILRVVTFDQKLSSAERGECLKMLKSEGAPVSGRLVQSATATVEFFEQKAAKARALEVRSDIMDQWDRKTAEELIGLLEEASFEPPMLVRDERIILEHLWAVHRDELVGVNRARLHRLLTTQKLQGGAAWRAQIYVSGLNRDRHTLEAIWKGELPGRENPGDEVALMEAFAHVATKNRKIVSDIRALFDRDGPFFSKFEAMINLGRIGNVDGERSAEVIRKKVYDSGAYIIAARDRVVARLTTPSNEWERCGVCCYGHVHGTGGYRDRCAECLGIGFVPRSQAEA